jgi:hypothetical protein
MEIKQFFPAKAQHERHYSHYSASHQWPSALSGIP